MKRSRLSRRLERKTQKNLILNLLGIVVVLFILFKFGIPFLINVTLFISGGKSTQSTKQDQTVFVAPPVLNPIPSATNSAQIVISGIASSKQSIELYVNGDLTNKEKTKDDGTFSFEETLKPGVNTIKTKATIDSTSSEFSQDIIVLFKNDSPMLSINSPTDGQSFSKDQNTVTVSGSTDPDVKVTVNDFWAIADENNNFSYTFLLHDGNNQIKVLAVDLAGNITEKDLKVIYTP